MILRKYDYFVIQKKRNVTFACRIGVFNLIGRKNNEFANKTLRALVNYRVYP